MKMYGSTLRDSLFGGKGKDEIFGDLGNDLISAWETIGDAAADKIEAGGGNDLISGFMFDMGNPARSKSRGASVDGGAGFDSLIVDASGKGKTILLSDMSAVFKPKDVEEIIYNFDKATARQTITGTNFNETIYIGENTSKAIGGKGDDYLFGGRGEDVLIGGEGSDFLSAAGGRNTLTGGKGADWFQFHLTDDYSYSNITDFDPDVDKIALVLDIGGVFNPTVYGDGLRLLERPVDEMGYLNYDNGRIMDRDLFATNSTFYTDNMIYEQSTGSFLQIYYEDDGNGGTNVYTVLLAHLEGEPELTSDNFEFYVL